MAIGDGYQVNSATGGWGSSRYQDWLNRLRGWTPPSQTEMETVAGNGSATDQARAWLQRMFADTDADRFLSPWYMRGMKQNAIRPYLEQSLLAGAEYGQAKAGNFGEFLKNWVSMGRSGIGNVGNETDRLNQLLARIKTGREAPTNSSEYELYSQYKNNPELFSAMMGLGSHGLFRNYAQSRIADLLEQAQVSGDAGVDWIDYLLSRMPSMGLRY